MASLTTITNLMASIRPDQTAEYLAKLSKELYYLLQNLDSLNVTSINTNSTTIESEDGTTILDGGQIIMKDTSNVTRLVMGVNGSGVFQYVLYDDTGTASLSIDSNGRMAILGGSGVANLSDSGALATRNTVNGTYIDDNSITTPKIVAGAVTATEINVSSLSAISANIGSVTAGTITGVTITGTSIYGGKYYNTSGSTCFDMTRSSDILLVDSSSSGLSIDVETGPSGSVQLASRTSSSWAVFLTVTGFSPTTVTASGSWDFGTLPTVSSSNLATQSWVTGKTYATQSYACEDYSSQGIEFQYFTDHLEVRLDGDSTWKSIDYI